MVKKYISLILLLFFCSTNITFAAGELYTLKNANLTNVKTIVENEFIKNNLFIIKDNPIIGTSYFGDNRAIVILEQQNDKILYYFDSDTDSSINKSILKNFTYNNYVCEQNTNQSLKNNYAAVVQKYIYASVYPEVKLETAANSANKNNSRYTFNENSNNTESYVQTNNYAYDTTPLKGHVVQVPSGTKMNVYLQSAINTSTASAGDEIIAVLTDDLKINGSVIAPQGSLIYGKLKSARSAGYAMKNGRFVIDFNKLVTTENLTYNISTEEIDFDVTSEGQVSGAVKTGLALAAIGALAGLLIASGSSGGYSHYDRYGRKYYYDSASSSNKGKGAAIGAGIGVAAGVAGALGKKGTDAEVPSLTQLELTLTKPFSVSVTY